MKVKVWVLELPFPCHNRPDSLPLLWYKVFQYCKPDNDTSSQVGSWLVPPIFYTILLGSKKLLLQFHRLTAAANGSIAATGYNELRTAFFTDISFSHLICHFCSPPSIFRFILLIQKLRLSIFFTKIFSQDLAHRVSGQRTNKYD